MVSAILADRPIKTEADYESVLERVYELMQLDLEPSSVLGNELEVLSQLVEAYEEAHYPVPKQVNSAG